LKDNIIATTLTVKHWNIYSLQASDPFDSIPSSAASTAQHSSMGTYLSTPVTEKNEESGESLQCPVTPLAWGVVDMQGWRKSMEDSHVAQTDIDVPAHHFDGPATKNVDGKVCTCTCTCAYACIHSCCFAYLLDFPCTNYLIAFRSLPSLTDTEDQKWRGFVSCT
jgi:hypothetical protein